MRTWILASSTSARGPDSDVQSRSTQSADVDFEGAFANSFKPNISGKHGWQTWPIMEWAMQLPAAILATTLLAASAVHAEQQVLSQTELGAMRQKIMAHWNPDPLILSQPNQYVVVVRFHLDRDGRLSAP